MSTLSKVLAVVNRWEGLGKLFFNRTSDDSMVIHVRDPRLWGGDPNVEHWQNAREVYEELLTAGAPLTSTIQIDRQSGTLVIRVGKVYSARLGSEAAIRPEAAEDQDEEESISSKEEAK